MPGQLVSTKSFTGMRAVTEEKGRKIGKVHHVVFHPSQKKVIGLLIKRPDAAMMFHRKDLFVALDGFHQDEGQIIVHADPRATDAAAIKALGVNWDDCVIWVGMPVMTQSGSALGYIASATFDLETGVVQSITTENGIANDAILGKRNIPASFIKGFKRGQGIALVPAGTHEVPSEGEQLEAGAILVSDDAYDVTVEGGVAAAAGKASAVAAHTAKKSVTRVKRSVDDQVQRAKPTAQRVATKTGEAVEAGTFAVGKQLGRATGMFSAFKEEFDKASKGGKDTKE